MQLGKQLRLFLTVSALLLALCPPVFTQQNWTEVDRQIRILQNDANEQSRLTAAAWLSKELKRPSADHLRQLSQVLRAAASPRVRCAVAGVFAALGRQARFHTGSGQPLPDESSILNALRQALIYEDVPLNRCCIIDAAADFDSPEAQVIIDRAKSDLSDEVRNCAQAAEYRRRNRLSMLGLRP